MESKPRKCPGCSSETKSYGWQQLQVVLRGTFPLERTLPLEVLVCPKCGRMDFYALEDTRKVLESGKAKPDVRLCHVCRHEAPYYGECPRCGALPKDKRAPMF